MIEVSEYVDGEKFESIADFGFGDKYTTEKKLNIDELRNFISNFSESRLPLIYCDSDRVIEFFSLLNHSNFKLPFALLSHNGDSTFTSPDRPECVVKWFGQNLNCDNNENIMTLPIGLERPHWSKKRYGVHSFKHNKIFEYSNHKQDKKHLLYLNFNQRTNPNKRAWIQPYFSNINWAYIRMGGIRGNLDNYFNEVHESKFILCPDGNGIDCHRTWEVLYLGGTPVLEKSENHRNLYDDLPVLMVDSFKDLTEDFLNESHNFSNNRDKLLFSYWKKKIFDRL